MTHTPPPSPIEAVHASEETSKKYGFVSTRCILDALKDEGFTPTKTNIARANKPERAGFQKHTIRLAHNGLLPSLDSIGRPEIVLRNSHDARSSLAMTLGFYVKICSNGLVASQAAFSERVVHRAVTTDAAVQMALNIAKMSPVMQNSIGSMRSHEMERHNVRRFVSMAAALRYPDPTDYQLTLLNRARRTEDEGDTLWQVFNRVQENLTQGVRAQPGERGIRKVTGVGRDFVLNKKLWSLAEGVLLWQLN